MTKFKSLFSRKKAEESENGLLRVDCRECENRFDMGSKRCMACFCDHVGTGDYDGISLVSGSETRYKEDASRIFIWFARSVNAIAQDADGRCDGCPLSGRTIREEILSDPSSENISYVETRIGAACVDCERCSECISSGKASVERFSAELKELMNDSLITAFKLVGA